MEASLQPTEQRRTPRHSGRGLEAIRVDVAWQERNYAGFPRNISRGGASLCLPGPNALRIPTGAVICGQLAAGADQLNFRAAVVWTQNGERQGKPAMMLGLQFDQELPLPAAVLAAAAD